LEEKKGKGERREKGNEEVEEREREGGERKGEGRGEKDPHCFFDKLNPALRLHLF